MAKAAAWPVTDAEARKRGEQIGLETLVVHAVNDEEQVLGVKSQCRRVVHAVNDEEQVLGVKSQCRSQRSDSSAWGVCTQV